MATGLKPIGKWTQKAFSNPNSFFLSLVTTAIQCKMSLNGSIGLSNIVFGRCHGDTQRVKLVGEYFHATSLWSPG